MTLRIVTLVFLGFVAAACANASSKVYAEAGGEVDPMAASVIAAVPSTFEVKLDSEARQHLESLLSRGSLDVARLRIRDVRPRSAQALKGVRIFLEKPDAGPGTPANDPHYAGNFVLGLGASQSMLLNVAPALSRLWSSGELTPRSLDERQALRVTFVPEPADFAAALPRDFALAFKSLTLEMPSRP